MNLTKAVFDQFLDGEIIRVTETRAQNFHEPFKKNLRFVVCKGKSGLDWAIYAGSLHAAAGEIQMHGDKVHSADIIKSIMPCDDEMFKLYRY